MSRTCRVNPSSIPLWTWTPSASCPCCSAWTGPPGRAAQTPPCSAPARSWIPESSPLPGPPPRSGRPESDITHTWNHILQTPTHPAHAHAHKPITQCVRVRANDTPSGTNYCRPDQEQLDIISKHECEQLCWEVRVCGCVTPNFKVRF